MIEITVVKRKAKYAGETGLFAVDQSADEDMARIGTGETAWAEITTPENLKLLRLLWAIAQKLADGGLYLDKDEAMEDLKIRAKFARFGVDKDKIIIVPRSLSRQSRDVLGRLCDRFVYIVCSDLLPHMEPSHFKQEIEEMVTRSGPVPYNPPQTQTATNGQGAPDQADRPRRKRRTKAEMEAARAAEAASEGEVTPIASNQDPETEPPSDPTQVGAPSWTVEAYNTHCQAWISEATDFKTAMAQWNDEADQRDAIALPVDQRLALRTMIENKFERGG